MKISAILRKTKAPTSVRDARVYIRIFVAQGKTIRMATALTVCAEFWDNKVPGYKVETPLDLIPYEEQETVNVHIRRVLKIVTDSIHEGCDTAWLNDVLSGYDYGVGVHVNSASIPWYESKNSTPVCNSGTPSSKSSVSPSQSSVTQRNKKSSTLKSNSSTPMKSDTQRKSCTLAHQSSTPKATLDSSLLRPKGYSAAHINKRECELEYEKIIAEQESTDGSLFLTDCFEQYLAESNFNEWHHQALSSVLHRVQRYEKWLGHTLGNNDFRLYMEDFDREQVEDFADYMMHESEYKDAESKFFEQFNIRNPKWIRPMSKNSCICSIKRLNMFLNWAVRKDLLHDRSFRQMTCDQQIYGTPYYLTLEERDRIAALDLTTTPRLEYHRNKFIFQCHVGCRLGDLNLFTWEHINGNFLEYIPHKNLLRGRTTLLRVPLTEQAKEILMNTDPDAHYLFHNYENEIYRQDIKEILRKAGIDREVMVYNSIKETAEPRKLYEVAASHLARRTFIGNLYKEVKDPALIASLTGHTETSTSFNRYRTIDDDIKRDILKFME